MKGIVLTVFLGVMTGMAVSGQVIRDENAEVRKVSGFHSIRVSHSVDLHIVQSDEEAVAVSAGKPQYRDHIVTVVEDSVLKIYYEDNSVFWRGNKNLKAYVSVRMLKGLVAGGSSDVYIQNGLTTDVFKLSIGAASDFRGRVTASAMEVKLSGASDVHISGKVANLKITAGGGSDFHGYGLIAENVFVSAGGGSDVRVTATNEIGVEASGGSDVEYKGNAVLKYKSLNGGGSLTKRD